MVKFGWFALGILVALSISTIADEPARPDEARLRELAATASLSIRIENKLQKLKRDTYRIGYLDARRVHNGTYYDYHHPYERDTFYDYHHIRGE